MAAARLMLQSTLQEIEPLRIGYLAGLPEFQDIYLEFLVGDAEVIRLQQGSETVGYALIHDGKVLIELCLSNSIPDPLEWFSTLIRDWQIEQIYCKSFDNLQFGNFDLDSVLWRNIDLKKCLQSYVSGHIGSIFTQTSIMNRRTSMWRLSMGSVNSG